MAKGKYEEWLTEEGLVKLEGWARDGLTDEQIADNMGIGVSTLYKYKNEHIEIVESLKRGKEVIDRHVENALLKRAMGYEYKETTREIMEDASTGKHRLAITKVVTKQVAPDTTAQIFWLKNRKPAEWRDKHEIESRSEVVNKHEYHIEQNIKSDPETAELLKQLYKRSVNSAVGNPS
jgi:transcriptional regulator with XRE-family HTH domain